MLLMMVAGVWRDVEVVVVGDFVRGLFVGALVWGDVDPHGGGLGARYADGGAIVVEVRASTLYCRSVLSSCRREAAQCGAVRCGAKRSDSEA
jgi:hypothetical protein